MKNKKAAIELSMSTIVVLVLAMSMLILGLILVKSIFSGATYNVDQMNNKVKDQINQLFAEDQKMVVYLANNNVEIKQGQEWGVAFVVKNILKDSSISPKFSYEVTEVESSCTAIDATKAMSYIKLGKKSDSGVAIAPGDTEGWVVRFSIPETSPLCMIRYNIAITADGQTYTQESFDISILAK
jgi:hypothetical protein